MTDHSGETTPEPKCQYCGKPESTHWTVVDRKAITCIRIGGKR